MFRPAAGRASGHQGADLVDVSSLDLVESDHTETGVVRVRGIREGYSQRPNSPRHETLASGCGSDAVCPFTALACGLFVDFPSELLRNGSSMIF